VNITRLSFLFHRSSESAVCSMVPSLSRLLPHASTRRRNRLSCTPSLTCLSLDVLITFLSCTRHSSLLLLPLSRSALPSLLRDWRSLRCDETVTQAVRSSARVRFTCYQASTPRLATRSSSWDLDHATVMREVIFRSASRLDAFSAYPFWA
jgi:hypothetical protein